jgi:hypothetical protein
MNLLTIDNRSYADLFARAVSLGISDETNRETIKTGDQVRRMLGVTEWRVGHVRFLKRAYMAGRFHVETMGEP